MANEKNLKPFKPGLDERRNTGGRPKKFVTLMKEQGYTQSEVNDTIQVLLALNIKELAEVFNDPNATALEKACSAAIRKAIERGSLYNIETLLTRSFGKPKETVDQNITGNLTSPIMVNVISTGHKIARSEKEIE